MPGFTLSWQISGLEGDPEAKYSDEGIMKSFVRNDLLQDKT